MVGAGRGGRGSGVGKATVLQSADGGGEEVGSDDMTQMNVFTNIRYKLRGSQSMPLRSEWVC